MPSVVLRAAPRGDHEQAVFVHTRWHIARVAHDRRYPQSEFPQFTHHLLIGNPVTHSCFLPFPARSIPRAANIWAYVRYSMVGPYRGFRPGTHDGELCAQP